MTQARCTEAPVWNRPLRCPGRPCRPARRNSSTQASLLKRRSGSSTAPRPASSTGRCPAQRPASGGHSDCHIRGACSARGEPAAGHRQVPGTGGQVRCRALPTAGDGDDAGAQRPVVEVRERRGRCRRGGVGRGCRRVCSVRRGVRPGATPRSRSGRRRSRGRSPRSHDRSVCSRCLGWAAVGRLGSRGRGRGRASRGRSRSGRSDRPTTRRTSRLDGRSVRSRGSSTARTLPASPLIPRASAGPVWAAGQRG